MKFFVYENWRAGPHKAKIHKGDCKFCNHGKGIHAMAGDENGTWHGPFDTVQEAINAAHQTGGHVSPCGICVPYSQRKN